MAVPARGSLQLRGVLGVEEMLVRRGCLCLQTQTGSPAAGVLLQTRETCRHRGSPRGRGEAWGLHVRSRMGLCRNADFRFTAQTGERWLLWAPGYLLRGHGTTSSEVRRGGSWGRPSVTWLIPQCPRPFCLGTWGTWFPCTGGACWTPQGGSALCTQCPLPLLQLLLTPGGARPGCSDGRKRPCSFWRSGGPRHHGEVNLGAQGRNVSTETRLPFLQLSPASKVPGHPQRRTP